LRQPWWVKQCQISVVFSPKAIVQLTLTTMKASVDLLKTEITGHMQQLLVLKLCCPTVHPYSFNVRSHVARHWFEGVWMNG
jgi:hypothetical protein